MFERIRQIIESTIGEPKRENIGWREYNCPYCALEAGVESDGKYNLAVNYGEDGVTKPYFHCWKCETSGKLQKLLRDFGTVNSLREYKTEMKGIRESLLYNIGDKFQDFEEINIDADISLPEDFRKINKKDKYAKEPYEYLIKRGLNDYFINEYNIGYIPYWSKDWNMRSRIVIPSYDQFGELNYYVARDYTGKRLYRKYNNPDIKKTMFVFNEHRINWYEDVTLVEGTFDHMVVPNSIPLLGKTLKRDYAVFQTLIKKAKADVYIFLDPDAIEEAKKMFILLNSTKLKNKVKLILCPEGYDASDIYRIKGKQGISELFKNAIVPNDLELAHYL